MSNRQSNHPQQKRSRKRRMMDSNTSVRVVTDCSAPPIMLSSPINKRRKLMAKAITKNNPNQKSNASTSSSDSQANANAIPNPKPFALGSHEIHITRKFVSVETNPRLLRAVSETTITTVDAGDAPLFITRGQNHPNESVNTNTGMDNDNRRSAVESDGRERSGRRGRSRERNPKHNCGGSRGGRAYHHNNPRYHRNYKRSRNRNDNRNDNRNGNRNRNASVNNNSNRNSRVNNDNNTNDGNQGGRSYFAPEFDANGKQIMQLRKIKIPYFNRRRRRSGRHNRGSRGPPPPRNRIAHESPHGNQQMQSKQKEEDEDGEEDGEIVYFDGKNGDDAIFEISENEEEIDYQNNSDNDDHTKQELNANQKARTLRTHHPTVLASEDSLQRTPLQLVCRQRDFDWHCILSDENRRSFAGYLANPFSAELLQEWSDKAMADLPWTRPLLRSGFPLNRKTVWTVAGTDCRCRYAYGSLMFEPVVFPEWLQSMTRNVVEATGLQFECPPNSCNINLYENGWDAVGWHSDNEPLFESTRRDCLILSLSLGCSRNFQMRLKSHCLTDAENEGDEGDEASEIVLHSGDVCTMEGRFQKYYEHRIPKAKWIRESRLNFTWRWITRHNQDRDGCAKQHSGGTGPGKVSQLKNRWGQ